MDHRLSYKRILARQVPKSKLYHKKYVPALAFNREEKPNRTSTPYKSASFGGRMSVLQDSPWQHLISIRGYYFSAFRLTAFCRCQSESLSQIVA